MASTRQLAFTSETLRWNILEMIALEEELESEAPCPEDRERISRRLRHLKDESPGLAAQLQDGVTAWKQDSPMRPSCG